MPRVPIPQPLRDLLAGSPLEAPTLQFADQVNVVLADNTTPFFSGYTDHGGEHVGRVLSAACRLIPAQVISSELLSAADATVLVGSALLHDLGMHIRETTFCELLTDESRPPVAWFDRGRANRPPDLSWAEEWRGFQREVRRFGRTQVERVLGPNAAEIPSVAYDESLEPGKWVADDYLLIGEFLRRSHARFAHEVALLGLPGVPAREFASVTELMPTLADAIGVTARSHGEDLRTVLDYVEYKYPGDLRPAGARLPFLMALLRIADYLQIDADRAPSLLLRLKSPRSEISLHEWLKHRAVATVSWEHRGASAIYIHVSDQHSLQTHLGVRELAVGLQSEMDTSAAVLDEVYPYPPLAAMRLSRTRVVTNLDAPSLHDQLPFVPRAARLRNSEDLFRLVVRDLYGDNPSVGGRELLQNATDAVKERRRLRKARAHADAQYADCPDVAFDVRQVADGQWTLVVTDQGVGMTPDTVIDYFLQAGASLGPNDQDLAGIPAVARARVSKTGRFGIGACAAFLIGDEVTVQTRHIDSERGVTFSVRANAALVELRWTECLAGTEISIPFLADEAAAARLVEKTADYLAVADPEVRFTMRNLEGDVVVDRVAVGSTDEWRRLDEHEFDMVRWSPTPAHWRVRDWQANDPVNGLVAVNGYWIHKGSVGEPAYRWRSDTLDEMLLRPTIAVEDSRHRLGITLQRYALQDRVLPFDEALMSAVGVDLVGYAMAGGADTHPLGRGGGLAPVTMPDGWFPLLPSLARAFAPNGLLVVWDSNSGANESSEEIARRSRNLGSADRVKDFASERGLGVVVIRSYSPRQSNLVIDWSRRATRSETVKAWLTGSGLDHHLPYSADRWQSIDVKSFGGTVEGFSSSAYLDDDLVRLAVGMTDVGGDSVMLSKLGRFREDVAEDSAVARPWLELLGGPCAAKPQIRDAARYSSSLAESVELWSRRLAPARRELTPMADC